MEPACGLRREFLRLLLQIIFQLYNNGLCIYFKPLIFPHLSSILSILISILFSAASSAYSVTGTVQDASDGTPVVGADVLVTDLEDKVVAYGATDSRGRFSVGGITPDEVLVLVRMMGYDTFVSGKLKMDPSSPLDLGGIKLERASTGLQEVTVVGEKNRIVYKLDRQLISGSSSITSAGGTAVDILSGLPSVLVDSEGNLSFRGSTRFLVYVDGKPSPLEGTAALQQIPAASVEDIEILTTPSARYRTDGDAGIINITTRKSTSDQWSGLFTATGSTLGTWASTVPSITGREGTTGTLGGPCSRSREEAISPRRRRRMSSASRPPPFPREKGGAVTGLT